MAKMDDLLPAFHEKSRQQSASSAPVYRRDKVTQTYYQPSKIKPKNDDLGIKKSNYDGEVTTADTEGTDSNGLQRFLLVSFVFALIFPMKFYLGSLNFTFSRAYLTVAILPILVYVLKNCRLGSIDVLMLLYGTWAAICITVNQGFPGGIEPAGSHFIEVAGSYFLARAAIQTVADFRYWAKLTFICVCLLLPAALAEFFTGVPVILEFFRKFMFVHSNVIMPTRLGFDRVQAVFDHPILYGVFCAGTFSSSVLLVPSKPNGFGKHVAGFIVVTSTFLSLSVGAYLNLLWQLAMMAWNRILKSMAGRWKLLLGLCIFSYVTIDVISNRTPFEVFISYFTFDISSSYMRVIQWRWGLAELYRNPIFGLGLFNDWIRPHFVQLSVDNFWLLRAMRFGFPGVILLVLLAFTCARVIAKCINSSNSFLAAASLAQLSGLIGSCVSLVTVDIWGGSQVLFFFSLGAIASLAGNYSEVQKPN
jgi:hypothetical protein